MITVFITLPYILITNFLTLKTMKVLFFLVLFCLPFIAIAQPSEGCGTDTNTEASLLMSLPYFGNMTYLEQIADSVHQINRNSRLAYQRYVYQIPVTAWVYEQVAGDPNAIYNQEVEKLINDANAFFESLNSPIFLYLNCVKRQVDPEMAFDSLGDYRLNRWTNNRLEGNINVHFLRGGVPYHGLAAYPWNPQRYTQNLTFTRGSRTPSTLLKIFLHELGHNLGLHHTHHPGVHGGNRQNGDLGSTCEQEAVVNTRLHPHSCFRYPGQPTWKYGGDLLKDTDGDPGYLFRSGTGWDRRNPSAPQCSYNITDLWGDSFGSSNALSNIMSYAPYRCQTEFTLQQLAVMYKWIEEEGTRNPYPAPRFVFTGKRPIEYYENRNVDEYENDNHWQNARLFSGTATEERSFHRHPGEEYICDEDWVRFEVVGGQPTLIQTLPMFDGQRNPLPQPEMRMELYSLTSGSLSAPLALVSANNQLEATSTDANLLLLEDLPTGEYVLRLSPHKTH